MLFIIVLILTTFAIAASAAYFSVYGMAQVFAGAMIPAIIMGASLEAGKLVGASFLYRFSYKIGRALKVYMASAILVLMLITSMGIFGFLTSAYQSDTLPLVEMNQKIVLLKEEKGRITDRLAQIDKQIADVDPNYVRAKQRLVKEFAEERQALDSRLNVITPELQELETKQINVKAKVGPIMFIAEVLGKDPDVAVIWFIFILILVFDPLAIALTIATNIAINNYKEVKEKEQAAKDGPTQKVNMDSLRAYIDKQIKSQSANTNTAT